MKILTPKSDIGNFFQLTETIYYNKSYCRINNGAPPGKLVLGIPTFGRAWAMTSDSDVNGTPPVTIDGAAEPGPVTKTAGILSYPEICELLTNPNNAKIPFPQRVKRIPDPSKRKGTYLFRIVDENNNGGLWVGYEDEDTVSYKASYAKAKNLGGIAIDNLADDDYKGTCGREKYDLLRTAVSHL